MNRMKRLIVAAACAAVALAVAAGLVLSTTAASARPNQPHVTVVHVVEKGSVKAFRVMYGTQVNAKAYFHDLSSEDFTRIYIAGAGNTFILRYAPGGHAANKYVKVTTTGAWLVSHKANATVIREGPGQSGNYPLRVGDSHHLVTDVNGTIAIRHPNGPFGHPGSHQLWHFWH